MGTRVRGRRADRLAARATELAAELAALPTKAIGMTKRLLDRAEHAALEDQLEWEAQIQAAVKSTDFAKAWLPSWRSASRASRAP